MRGRKGRVVIQSREHKKRKLDSEEEVKLCRALGTKTRPPRTAQLSAVVRGKVAAHAVSDYLARADPPFTTRVLQDQEPEELTEEWRAGARRWLEGVKKIRLDKRIYEDETPVFANEAPKRGRARTGNTHSSSAISLRHKVHVCHVYAKRSGVLHWGLSDSKCRHQRD